MVTIARLTTGLLLGIAAVLALFSAAGVEAQEDNGPRVISQSLEDGAVFGEVPYIIQLCFSEPVDTENSGEGAGFSFEITTPEGRAIGKRNSFQRNGLGVQIYTGAVPALPTGFAPAEDQTWTFKWRVTAQDDEAPAEGMLTFSIEEGAEIMPEERLPDCRGEVSEPTATASGTDDVGDGAGNDGAAEEDDETDVLYIVLLASAAIGALAAVSGAGYLIRRRGGGGDGPTAGGTRPD